MIINLSSIINTYRLAFTERVKIIRWHNHKKNGPIIRRALDLMPCDDLLYSTYISHRNQYVYIKNPELQDIAYSLYHKDFELLSHSHELPE